MATKKNIQDAASVIEGKMGRLLHILVIDDSKYDPVFTLKEIEKAGYTTVSERVDTKQQLQCMLPNKSWDIILCDYKMPFLTVAEALETLEESGQDIPFIVLSGVVGEEVAVECMRAGASDFIPKNKLVRLVPAIERELKDAEARRAQRKLETSLKESEFRLRRIMDSGMIGVLYWKSNGKIEQTNDAFLNMLGYTCDDFQQGLLDHLKIAPSEFDPLDEQIWEQLRATSICKPFEKQLMRKDGGYIDVLVVVACMEHTLEEGVAVYLDITERKQAEQALMESEQRFRTMADSLPALIWMTSLNGHCHYVNKGWLIFTGRTLEQELGEGWSENIHPEDLAYWRKTYSSAVQEYRDFDIEYRLKRADGQYRWVFNKGIPRFSDKKEFLGYIGSCIDITEGKQVREELERRVAERTKQLQMLNQELKVTNRELAAFSYSVSHDLRTPLRALDGFAYILADTYGDLLNTKGKRYINAIRENSQHMAQMLDDFLRLFRLRNEPLKIETIDMTAMAQKTFATHISRYANSHYTLNIDALPEAKGDPELIRQIWSNLLDNAMKFTREKENPIIEIGGYTTDKYHVYSVKDNGIGFDTDYKNKLFGVFERLHPDRFEGMGVGLAIVSRIVQLHGGYVDAKGNVNQGATFYFALPLQNIGVVTEYSLNRAIDTLHLTQNNSLS